MLAVPLIILLVLTLFSFIFTGTYFSASFEGLVHTESIINGSTTTLEVGEASNYFSVDPLLGALTWVTIIVILASALGIRVLGSGLADMSIRTVILATFYIAVFVALSLFGYPFVLSIPYNLGLVIFIGLSVVYAFGIFKQIGG
jgi:hypothetical protein